MYTVVYLFYTNTHIHTFTCTHLDMTTHTHTHYFFLSVSTTGQEEGGEGSDGRWGSRGEGTTPPRRLPDPNNPMEYCSRVPPPQQAAAAPPVPPPTVMVPVGVLKREGKYQKLSLVLLFYPLSSHSFPIRSPN